MEGYSLRLKDEQGPVATFSVASMKVLSEALRQADLVGEVNRSVVRCVKDYDFRCKENGCLQGDMPGCVVDIGKLSAVYKKARDWLEDNPDFDSGIEGEEVYLDENGEVHSGGTDSGRALRIVERLIEILRELAGKQEKEATLLNEATEENIHPCARQIDLYGRIRKEGKEGVLEIERQLLDYDYAKSNQEELERVRYKWLTREEAIKRGIVFAEISER